MVLFDSPQTISYSVVHCNHVAILTVSENRNWPIGILQHVTTAGCIWKCRVYCCVTRCIVQVQLLIKETLFYFGLAEKKPIAVSFCLSHCLWPDDHKAFSLGRAQTCLCPIPFPYLLQSPDPRIKLKICKGKWCSKTKNWYWWCRWVKTGRVCYTKSLDDSYDIAAVFNFGYFWGKVAPSGSTMVLL